MTIQKLLLGFDPILGSRQRSTVVLLDGRGCGNDQVEGSHGQCARLGVDLVVVGHINTRTVMDLHGIGIVGCAYVDDGAGNAVFSRLTFYERTGDNVHGLTGQRQTVIDLGGRVAA